MSLNLILKVRSNYKGVQPHIYTHKHPTA